LIKVFLGNTTDVQIFRRWRARNLLQCCELAIKFMLCFFSKSSVWKEIGSRNFKKLNLNKQKGLYLKTKFDVLNFIKTFYIFHGCDRIRRPALKRSLKITDSPPHTWNEYFFLTVRWSWGYPVCPKFKLMSHLVYFSECAYEMNFIVFTPKRPQAWV